jgi:hypothetical protein
MDDFGTLFLELVNSQQFLYPICDPVNSMSYHLTLLFDTQAWGSYS